MSNNDAGLVISVTTLGGDPDLYVNKVRARHCGAGASAAAHGVEGRSAGTQPAAEHDLARLRSVRCRRCRPAERRIARSLTGARRSAMGNDTVSIAPADVVQGTYYIGGQPRAMQWEG